MVLHLNDIRMDVCAKEFLEFKKCIQKCVCAFGHFNLILDEAEMVMELLLSMFGLNHKKKIGRLGTFVLGTLLANLPQSYIFHSFFPSPRLTTFC